MTQHSDSKVPWTITEEGLVQFDGDLKLAHGEAIYPVISHEIRSNHTFFGLISGIGVISPSSPDSYELFSGEKRIGILDINPGFDLKIYDMGNNELPKWTIYFRGMKNDPSEAAQHS